MFLRVLLGFIFVVWLTWVLVQYYWIDTPNKSPVPNKPISTNISLAHLTLPPLPLLATRSQMTKEEQHTKGLDQEAEISRPSKQRVEQVYKQLSAPGISVELAWPRHAAERKVVFDFLYQCVGVQFAVLNESNVTHLNQPKNRDHSDWIRIAQGSLSNKEQNWLNAYGLTGTPIRLFPKSIDLRLASHLAQALKGEPLVSLRASYQISEQRLHLIGINLNNQPVTDSWLLYQDRC